MAKLLRDYIHFFVLGIFLLLYLILSLTLHFRFNTTDADLAIYSQHTWFLSIGEYLGYGGTFKDFNIFGDHFIAHLLWISWLYKIWHSAAVLIIVQTLAIVLSALPLYWFAKERLQDTWASLILITAYLLYYGYQAAEIFPFHGAALSTVFISFTLWFAYKRRWIWYFVALVGALLCKEDVPTFTFMLGLYLLFIRKDRKAGLATIIISLAYFYTVIFHIIPFFTQGRPYAYIVESQNSKLTNLWTLIYNYFFPVTKIKTQVTLFGSFGFLPLFSPSYLAMAFPFLLARFTSLTIQRWLPWMHYSANQGPILGFGSVFGLENLAKLLTRFKATAKLVVNRVRFYRVYLLATLLMTISIGVYYKMPIYTNFFNASFYQEKPELQSVREALNLIPEDGDVSVASQSGLLPHLALRRKIHMYPHPSFAVNEPRGDIEDDEPVSEYQVPDAEYIILSKHVFHWRPSNDRTAEIVDHIKQMGNYQVIFEKEGTVVFRKLTANSQ